MKDKKGFTLTELIGVIVLLGIIALIAVPIVNRTIKNSKEKAYDSQVEEIISSAKKWGVENNSKIDAEGRTTFLTVGNLIEDGYLEDDAILDPRDNTSLEDACVKIKYNNSKKEYIYTFDAKCDPAVETFAYAIYSQDDNSLTFIRSEVEPKVGEKYNNKNVTRVYSGFETEIYETFGEDPNPSAPWHKDKKGVWEFIENEKGERTAIASLIQKVVFEDTIEPLSTAGWFASFNNCQTFDLTNLNTSLVTDMHAMFYSAGSNVDIFEIIGLEDLDVSNVTNMEDMFLGVAAKATTWSLGDLSNWDVSKVQNMSTMFFGLARNSKSDFNFEIDGWKLSSVTDMSYMFRYAGYGAPNWNMTIKKIDTINLITTHYMFQQAGYNSKKWNLNIENWNTVNVHDMSAMFHMSGENSETWIVNGLDKLNTQNVTTMNNMFGFAGMNATSWYIGDLSNWETSKVQYFDYMFNKAGMNSTNWSIGDISVWNVKSSVTFNYMFSYAGQNTNYQLDLSEWGDRYNISSVRHSNFDTGVESKVISPWE